MTVCELSSSHLASCGANFREHRRQWKLQEKLVYFGRWPSSALGWRCVQDIIVIEVKCVDFPMESDWNRTLGNALVLGPLAYPLAGSAPMMALHPEETGWTLRERPRYFGRLLASTRAVSHHRGRVQRQPAGHVQPAAGIRPGS